VPRCFENFVIDVEVNGKPLELAYWDIGRDQGVDDRILSLSYADTHVILICFAVHLPESLVNARGKVRILNSIIFFLVTYRGD
jgi:GTPase SAR1 family protein